MSFCFSKQRIIHGGAISGPGDFSIDPRFPLEPSTIVFGSGKN